MPDAALAELGDIGHRALVVIGFDPFPDLDDEITVEAFLGRFINGIALIDQQEQDLIGFVVGEAQFILVGLPHP